MAILMPIGLVVVMIDDLPVGLCSHLGVLLSHGAARSNPRLLYRVQRQSTGVLRWQHAR